MRMNMLVEVCRFLNAFLHFCTEVLKINPRAGFW